MLPTRSTASRSEPGASPARARSGSPAGPHRPVVSGGLGAKPITTRRRGSGARDVPLCSRAPGCYATTTRSPTCCGRSEAPTQTATAPARADQPRASCLKLTHHKRCARTDQGSERLTKPELGQPTDSGAERESGAARAS